eukprot:16898-Prymnesium_polylepis.1
MSGESFTPCRPYLLKNTASYRSRALTTRVRALRKRGRAPLREPSDAAWHGRLRPSGGSNAWWEHARYSGGAHPGCGPGAAGEPVLVRTEALCAKLSDFVRNTDATSPHALWVWWVWDGLPRDRAAQVDA